MTESEKQQSASSPGGNASSIADLSRPQVRACLDRYWRVNVRLTLVLLGVWAFAGLGCGVLFADRLNQVNLPGTGFPLGFWFAHQGSIIIFVFLILIYCLSMNRLDARHHEQLAKLRAEEGAEE